jgi:hypothetical protein
MRHFYYKAFIFPANWNFPLAWRSVHRGFTLRLPKKKVGIKAYFQSGYLALFYPRTVPYTGIVSE